MICKDCPRNCNIDRNKQSGFCGAKNKIVVSKVIENFKWEEPCISGEKGTLAIFFAGCNLRCCFCQNAQISRAVKGDEYFPKDFLLFLQSYDLNKFSAIELITPSHYSSLLCETFENFSSPVPLIWNSSGYENTDIIEKVSSFVNVFLPDFKYGEDYLAREFSIVNDYVEVATQAIKKMSQLKKNIFDKGLLKQGVLIRHLILPGHIEDSFKVLDIIKENINDPLISLMSQFTPMESKIQRGLLPLEYKAVLAHASKLNLNNGYYQELCSSGKVFIPKF